MAKAKPKTGRKTDSELSTMLKKLSAKEPETNLPKMPSPTFDKYMGGKFKTKKKKN